MGRDLSRLLQLFFSLFILSLLCFGLLKFFPGSPFVEEFPADPVVIQELQKFYGLNEDLFTQGRIYFSRLLQGDLGTSMRFPGQSVKSLIWDYGTTSALLGFSAFLLAVLFSFLYSYWTRRSAFRFRSEMDLFLLLGISVPTLAAGPLLIWLICIQADLLPVALLEKPTSYILPIFILAFRPALSLSRVLSVSLDEVLRAQYVQVARSLGFSEKKILLKWALKNGLISYISQAAPVLVGLISGSFLVENLFAIPGLGFQFVESVLNRDWPLILGIALFYGLFLLIIQWVADCLIEYMNPKLGVS